MYYKVTNESETHNGFVYHDGLNILDKPFQEHGSCVQGGLYFTTIEHIPEFYSYGLFIREVSFPEDDPYFRMVMDPAENKYRANKIILGKRYSLLDPDTYYKLGLNIKNDDILYYAVTFGNITLLNALKKANYNFKGLGLVDSTSAYNQIGFLQWWLESEIDLEYSEHAMDGASGRGHINILSWWLHSGMELKYSVKAINKASVKGYIDSLNWWKYSGLILKYTNYAMDYAFSDNRIVVLNWWLSSGVPLKYSKNALHMALARGFIDILSWWYDSDLGLKYDDNAMDIAITYGHAKAVNWWRQYLSRMNLRKIIIIH